MKYYWAKWNKQSTYDHPFFVALSDDGRCFRISGSGELLPIGPTDAVKKHYGLIIGPEIPGPPEEWR